MTVTKYELTENNNTEFWAIKLVEGVYTGVVYSYDTIKFTGETENGEGILAFTYHIHDAAGNDPDDLKGSVFETVVGDILVELLEQSINYMSEKNERNDDDDNRTEDSVSTDL